MCFLQVGFVVMYTVMKKKSDEPRFVVGVEPHAVNGCGACWGFVVVCWVVVFALFCTRSRACSYASTGCEPACPCECSRVAALSQKFVSGRFREEGETD